MCSLKSSSLVNSDTKIRHENEAFRKCSSNRRNLKTPDLSFLVDRHYENGAFQKRMWFPSLLRGYSLVSSRNGKEDCVTSPKSLVVFLKHKSKMTGQVVAFSNFSGAVWTGPNLQCRWLVECSVHLRKSFHFITGYIQHITRTNSSIKYTEDPECLTVNFVWEWPSRISKKALLYILASVPTIIR